MQAKGDRVALVKKPCKLKGDRVALVKKPCKLKGDRVVLVRTLERMNVIDAQDALDTIETSPSASRTLTNREKNAFERNFGEGTAFDLDYGKLLIIALCIYIAIQVN